MVKTVKNQPFALPKIEHYPANPLRIRVDFSLLPTGATAKIVDTRNENQLSHGFRPVVNTEGNSLLIDFAGGQLSRVIVPVTLQYIFAGGVKMTQEIDLARLPVPANPDGTSFGVEVNEEGVILNILFPESEFTERAETAANEAQDILLAIQAISVLLNTLKTDVQALRNAVAQDAESAANSETSANSSASASANILVTINQKLATIQAAQAEIEAKRAEVSQNAAFVAQDSGDVNNHAIFVSQQRAIIEQVKAAIDIIKAAIDTTKTEIDGINTVLLVSRDTAVTAKNDATTAKNDAVTAKNDATTAKNDAVTARADALQAKADALQAKADTLLAKADALQAKADAIAARDAAIAAATNYVARPGSNVNTAYTINMALKDNQFHYLNLNGNTTFTINGIADGRAVWLRLVQTGAGGFVPTFPASVKWPGGAAPDINLTAGGVTIVALVANNDGTIDGTYAKM